MDEVREKDKVAARTKSGDEAEVTLSRASDRPGVAARSCGPVADDNKNVDMIVQNIAAEGKATDLTFTVTRADLERAVATLESRRDDLGYADLLSDPNVVKVSVVGVGMRSHAGVAQRMFKALADEGINIQVISTSEIKVSVLIDEACTEQAITALHDAYGLDVE